MANGLPRRMLRETTKLTLGGVTLGLAAWAASAGVREVMRKRAEQALEFAGQTPLGRVLPDIDLPRAGEPDVDLPRAGDSDNAPFAAAEPVEHARVSHEPLVAKPVAPEPAASDTGTAGSSPLPIGDFDTISVPSLRARLRRLTVGDLTTLRDWETVHSARPDVLSMLDNRIAKLRADPA